MDKHENITTGTEAPLTSSDASAHIPNGAGEQEDDELHLMEQFMNNPAHDYHNFQYGDTVDGRIVRIEKDSLLIDIGTKAEGVVPQREMQSLLPEDREALAVGHELLVFVVQAEHREGYAILSIDRARQEKSWRRLEQAHQESETITARVINYNKGGVLVSLDGVRGFVPASQVEGLSRASETQKQSDMARLVGEDIDLKVIEINRQRNRLILSERQANQERREEKKDKLLSTLNENETYTGKVSSVCDFGVFVDIGGADGLVHLSEISWGRVRHPGELLQVGDDVQVYLLSIDHERKRIALSIKRTQQEPWETLGERYELGQIIDGTITQVTSFGAFARVEDGVEGLIHISELGEDHVQHPRDVVKEGDMVQARVIRIDPARKRMGLSLRLPTAPDDAEMADTAASSEPEPAAVDENTSPDDDQQPGINS